jgi:2-dehydro-3-deoxyglucarate aldolase
MVLKDSPSAPVVRPPSDDPVVLKRLLDGGFANFLIPMVDTAEQAARAVAATRYPPQGIRGVSVSQRGNRYGEVKDYLKVANDHITMLVQVETRAAVAAAGEIAAVDGVDGVFIGPSDLAAAYGHLGNPNHPEVQEAIAQAHAAISAAGKPTGILTPVEADARRYLAMGMRFVAVGSDLGVLRTQSRALADKFREASGGTLGAQY